MWNCCNSCNTWQRSGCFGANATAAQNTAATVNNNWSFGTPTLGLFVPVSYHTNGSNGSCGSCSSNCRCQRSATLCCGNGATVRVSCAQNQNRSGCGCGCNGGLATANNACAATTGSCGCASNYDAYYARQYGLNTVNTCGCNGYSAYNLYNS